MLDLVAEELAAEVFLRTALDRGVLWEDGDVGVVLDALGLDWLEG